MTTVRALGYLRVSSKDQAEHGHSIEAQAAAIEAEAERRGWTLLELVRENGSAARGKKRPELDRLLALLAADEADVLLSTRVDRVARSVIDFMTLLETSGEQGWTLALTELSVDFSTPEGKLFASQLSGFAEFERDILSARTKDGLAAARAKGVALGRPRVMPARTRRRIERERAHGLSYAAIAEGLNVDDVETAHGGERWHASTVWKALHGPRLPARASPWWLS